MPKNNQSGTNPDINIANVPQDIWSVGGEYVWPTDNDICTCVSDDSADVQTTGLGTRIIRITGIVRDGNSFNLASEFALMNGLTPVVVTNEFYRVFLVESTAVGSAEANVGTIDVRNSTQLLARVEPDQGESRMALWTVPSYLNRGYALRTWGVGITKPMGVAVSVEAQLMVRPFFGSWRVTDVTGASSPGGQPDRVLGMTGEYLAPGTDVRISVSAVSANNMTVHGWFSADTDHHLEREVEGGLLS